MQSGLMTTLILLWWVGQHMHAALSAPYQPSIAPPVVPPVSGPLYTRMFQVRGLNDI